MPPSDAVTAARQPAALGSPAWAARPPGSNDTPELRGFLGGRGIYFL